MGKTAGKIDNEVLQTILKRDLILGSEECKNMGLVDEVIG